MIDFLKIFQEIVLKSPLSTAVVDEEGARKTSYKELDEVSGRIASFLKTNGIGTESVVLINCPRGMELIATRLGVMKIGAAWVCVEKLMGEERISFVTKSSDPAIVFDAETFKTSQEYPPLLYEQWADPNPHDLAFIIYTSGSTGTPKGAPQEYGIYDLILQGARPMAEPYLPAKLGNLIPESYVGGIYILIGILRFGGEIHEMSLSLARDPKGILSYFEKEKINITFMPPSLARVMLSTNSLTLDALHVGGEIVSDIYTDKFDVCNIYGPTEFGYPTCIFKLDKAYDNTPIGKPISGTKTILIDENGNKCDNEGILGISLPFFRGYIGSDLSKSSKNIDGVKYFITSDFARIKDENYTILGRHDAMIKLNGNRIDPSEVESAIIKATGARFASIKVCIIGGVSILCAYVPNDLEIDKCLLQKKLREYIPDYMIPTCFIKLFSLPLNANGKIDLKNLPDPKDKDLFAPYIEPLSETEKKLCFLTQKVLGFKKEDVGTADNFFLLGGDSVSAMNFVISSDIDVLTIQMLYEMPTIHDLALAIDNKISRQKEFIFPDEGLPLTDEQSYCLAFQEKYPDSTYLNLAEMITFNPNTDPEKLKAAVNKAFLAHPALFTVFCKKEDDFRQFLSYPEGDVCPICYEAEEKLKDILQNFVKPIKFDGSPLCHAIIVKTPQRLLLLMDLSHMVCDGISYRIVLEDILFAYQGEPIKKDQYTSYLIEALDYKKNALYIKDKKYYENKYNAPANYDRVPNPDITDENSGIGSLNRKIVFDRAIVKKAVKELASSESTIYLTALALALSEYNNSARDILLTFTYNGRNSLRYQRTVGLLIKDLPVSFRIDKSTSVRDLIHITSNEINETMTHCNISPYMQTGSENIMCYVYEGNMLNMKDNDLIQSVDSINRFENFLSDPIEFCVFGEDDGISFKITYKRDLYLPSSIEQFAFYFKDHCMRIISQYEKK